MRRLTFRQRQFLVLFVLAIVPLAIMSTVILPTSRNFVIDRATEQLETVADLKTVQVQQWLNQGREVALLASNLHEVREETPILLAQPASDNDNLAYAHLGIELDAVSDNFPHVQTISLLHSVDGQVMFSTDQTQLGRERQNEAYFRNGQHSLYVSPITYSVGREMPLLIITAPLWAADNQLLAVVAVEMNLTDLQATLANRAGLGETGRAYLVDAYGFYVTVPPDGQENPLRTIAKSVGVERALARQSGSDTYLDADGVRVLGLYRWLPDGNLGLLVEIDETELTAEIMRIWSLIGLLSLGLLASATFAARFLTNWLVSPLDRVVVGAGALQTGDLSHRVPSGGPDEIGKLAAAFNDMATSLQQSHENLEQLVEQRTAELRQANENLRQYERVVAVAHDTISLIDRDYVYQIVNEAALRASGKNSDQFIGHTMIEVIGEDRFGAIKQRLDECLDGKVVRFEMVRDQPDQTQRVMSVTCSPYFDEDNTVTGVAVMSRDITERKQAEQRHLQLALEQERMQILADFITRAAHEFKTPLSTINTSTYLVRKATDLDDRERHILKIEGQVKDITTLVDALNLMAKLDGGQDLILESFDLNEIIRTICDPQQSIFQEKNLNIVLELSESPLSLQADYDYLKQAIKHIVNNAVRYTPDDGTITVSSDHIDDNVVIKITDTGVGIGEDVLPRIFERFHRADVAGKTRGFGLGLPIAKAIIERHQGKIEVESTVGEGSTFRVLLPMA